MQRTERYGHGLRRSIIALLLGVGILAGIGVLGVASVGTIGALNVGAATPTIGMNHSPPSPFTWTNGNITIVFGGDRPQFYVSSVGANSSGSSNISVAVMGLAEITSTGGIVAVAPFSFESNAWNLTGTNETGGGMLVTLSGQVAEFPASGTWNASELPEPSVDQSSGVVPVQLAFHLAPPTAGAATWSVKFDVTATGWLWSSSRDSLGLGLQVTKVGSTTLEDSPRAVQERSNATGVPVAQLTWGTYAEVTYPNGTNATATVVGTTIPSLSGIETQVRLEFSGVPGGYDRIFYDPTVTVNPATGGPAGPGGGVGVLTAFTPGGIAGIAAGVAVVSGVALLLARRRRRMSPPS